MGALFASMANPERLDAAIAAIGPAIVGGLLPALVWLAFWLREDSERPEPRRIVFTTFLLGAATIPGTMVLQLVASKVFLDGAHVQTAAAWAPLATLLTLGVWALVEEISKLLAAYAGGLSRREDDEPIDATVYLVAAALGFSAAENFFYVFYALFTSGENGQVAIAVMSSTTRAVGATTLHVAAAAVLGIFGGYARYATPRAHRLLWVAGLALVTLLHLAFNALIIFSSKPSANPLAFAISWTVSLVAILVLEKVKAMRVESAERPRDKQE